MKDSEVSFQDPGLVRVGLVRSAKTGIFRGNLCRASWKRRALWMLSCRHPQRPALPSFIPHLSSLSQREKDENVEWNTACDLLLRGLRVVFDGWTGTDEIAVAVGIVDPSDRRPVFIRSRGSGREAALGSAIWS